MLCLFFVLKTAAQGRATQSIQQSETFITSSSYGLYFRGYNGADITLDNNGKPRIGGMDLEAIPGKLYWYNEYAPATLYIKGGKLLGEFKVRFEQLNQVFYVMDEKDKSVKVADPSLVERIVFNNPLNGWNSPAFTNNFINLSSKTKGLPTSYLQELEVGKFSLFKSNKSIIRYQDSLFGSIKKPSLVPQVTYFIFYKGDFSEFKKLSYKNIISAFPVLSEEFQKLSIQKSDLDDEKKVVDLFSKINEHLITKEK